MDAAKKTELEKRIVLGLAGVFVVFFVMGPLKSLGLLRSGGGAGRIPGSVDAVPITTSVGGMLRQGWEKVDEQVKSVAALPAPAPQSAATYTAFEMRDPLQSLLPKPAALTEAGVAAVAAEEPSRPPELYVEGLLWGGAEPKAIIGGRLYGVHDMVGGVKIVAIDRGGVTVDCFGKPVVYSTHGGKNDEGPAGGHQECRH